MKENVSIALFLILISFISFLFGFSLIEAALAFAIIATAVKDLKTPEAKIDMINKIITFICRFKNTDK